MRWIPPLFIALFVVLITSVMACGSVEPSQELLQLEQELRSEDTRQFREIPNAARYHEEARQYRRVSREAQEDGRGQRSQEYAILGLLRLQTAEAIYLQFQNIDELNEINAQVQQVDPQIREYTQARNELAQELQILDREIKQAKSGTASLASGEGGGDIVAQANERIAQADELRQEALEHNADEYDRTRSLFERAESQLERAKDLLSDNPRTAHRQAGFAVQLYEEANEIAIPLHAEMVEKMQPDNRIRAIQELASANYSGRFTENLPNGVRIIMARLFEPNEEDFRRETDAMLNVLADIVGEYQEFTVRIEGYTQAGGGATQNRTLSQVRAQRVRNTLIEAGIDGDRIETEGFGQSEIRYPGSPDNNDRVEVVFRHSER